MTGARCTRLLLNMHPPYFLSRKRLRASTVCWKLEECAVVIGGRSADLGPKLDLILWLGSLGLTCQGLPGFSAASSIGMLLVALCVHLDPTYVPGWQGRERSARGQGAEVVRGLPIAHHHLTCSIFVGLVCVASSSACCSGEEDSAAQAWEPVWSFSILEGRPPPLWLVLSLVDRLSYQ